LIGILQIAILVAEVVMAIFWLQSSNSNIEPIIIILGVVFAVLEIIKRNIRVSKNIIAEAPISINPSKIKIRKTILMSSPSDDWSINVDGLVKTAMFNEDTNLRIEMRDNNEGIQNDDFQEPWAKNHIDKQTKPTSYWCRIYYGGTMIEKVILVAVDGHKALIPIPKRTKSLHHPGYIPIFEYRVAMIFDSMNTLEEYTKRSGLSVEPGMN